MSKNLKISLLLGILLMGFILSCRAFLPLADFYSLHLYPIISATLTLIASIVPFSLMEITVIALVIALVYIIVHGIRKKQKFTIILLKETNLVLWIYVWFYLAWGTNYFRSDIFQRTQTTPVPYEENTFKDFLQRYTEAINSSYTKMDSLDKKALESHTKEYYSSLDKVYGLSNPKPYQHPKKQMFNFVHSAVGVSGYIGPAFDEQHVNGEIPEIGYPFTYAHEYAHVLGISNEAEANYWAYKVCTSSSQKDIRYSGYFNILAYVWNNARRILSQEEFLSWSESLKPEVKDDLIRIQEFWREKKLPWLDRIQTTLYNMFLKSNNISSGMKNYSEVLLIILSLEPENVNR